jgi:hypothetical protein
MKKSDFDNIQIRKFQVHSFIRDNPQCTAREVSLGVPYNLQSTQSRIRELEGHGFILRQKNKCANAAVFKSLIDPIPVIKFNRNRAETMPVVLLSRLWLPGHLKLG